MDETIVSGGAKAKDFTDDKKKEQFIDEKTLFEGVKDEKNEAMKCIYEKRTPKTYDVDEKDEDSGDNKSLFNNDVQDVDGSSSKYSKEDEIKFITLEKVELNKIRDLYKSTSISNNVFESFQSTERIFTAATEEFKSVCSQEEEIINTTTTKIDETNVNVQENKEKDANKSKKIIDNDINIKVEDIEFSGDEKVDEIKVPNDVEYQNLTGDKDKQWIDEETIPKSVKEECTWYKSITKTTNKSSFEIDEGEYSAEMDGDRKRSLRLDNSFIYNEDEEQIDLQYKIKQKHLDAQKQQKVKSYKSTFIQSLATRSQRLATSAKRLKRSGEAEISAPPQRIRLNDTTAATVTSIKQYTKNNDAEDLLQATWIENDETQISDDDETKKQQQSQQQQDHYLSSSELPIICQPSPSTIPTSKLSVKRYDRHQKRIIIGDHEDKEHNDNPSLVSALCFPKNIDRQMCINDENEGICVICNQDLLGRLVYHYVNAHRGCEIYNSRLSRSQIKLIKQGRCEVSNVSLYNGHKYYEAFCIFCQKNLRLVAACWYEHFTRHTGEYAFRCTGCGLRNIRHITVRQHQARKCPKAAVAQDYFRSSKSFFPMEANVCYLCNYVQLYRSNIEKHLHTQHNIKQILPEHVQKIVLLPKPTTMPSRSTGSKIDCSTGDEERDEIIVPDSAEAEDLTDDKYKMQLIDQKSLLESVDDEKNSKIEAAMNEKETSKICDVDEKDEESGDNKSFLNEDLDDSSSKYSAEDETEFISLEESELNKIRDLYKSTSINTNIFESLKSTERIVTAATEEFKGICPQVEKEINKTTTKINETIVNIKKTANKVKTVVNNDKNIKVEDIEIPGDEELNEIIHPDVAKVEDLTDDKKKIQLIDEEILPKRVEDESNPKTKNENESLSENDDGVHSYQTSQSNYLNAVQLQSETTNTTIYSTPSSLPYPNINSLTSSALKRERQHEVDEDEYTTDISKAQEQQVKSDGSAFIQSIATRSQRLTTSVKRFKRSTKAEISATVTSIKQCRGNNEAEGLLQATWIENDETQLSDDDEAKKQQQSQQQQDHYSSSELPTICQPSPGTIPTSRFSKRLYERHQKGIIIGVDDDNENNDNSSLVPALDWPKNVDPQMFINDENKDRCLVCNQDFVGRLVQHYVNKHRGCEIYTSRLSPSQIKLVKEGRCKVSNTSLNKRQKYYEAFCIFCQKTLRLLSRYWYQHFTRHTGEFAYRCTGCGLRRPTYDFKRHQAKRCTKASVVKDYNFNLQSLHVTANVCNFCNYVQLYRSNMERHLLTQHNIEQILPELIQKIVILSIRTSMTATLSGSKIDYRHWNKTGDAPSLPSSSHASNTYVNDDNDADNDVSFDKILPEETPTQTNPPTIENRFVKFKSCHKTTRDLNNSSLSILFPSHAEKNQQIVIDDDDENNDHDTLVTELGFPKNVDPQMFINDENRDRCVICNQDFIGRLVNHYVNEHRGCEIYNSRLSSSQIKLVKRGRCEVSNVSQFKTYKFYEAFCIFCEKNLNFMLRYWYEHFTRHTGEFAYRCTGCGLRKPRRPDFRKHQDQGCPKARVVQDYFRSSKSCFTIEANVCTLCNYVQLYRSNIETHLHMQHNIKEISPEHIQTISLLSKPTPLTTSTGSKIDSKPSNKSGAAPSLQSTLYASNPYVIYAHGDNNDVTVDKILPDETPPQKILPTSKNTFREFISCHKATRDLNNSDGSLSILLPLRAEKNQEIVIDDDDENNDNHTLVSALGFPKNVDPQMFINDETKDRCIICNKDFNSLVQHYVNEHRGCEIYNSRLSPSQIKLVKQGRCEVSNVSQYKSYKFYEAFCIFCEKNLHSMLRYWYEHFTRHTGEFAYRCTCCGLRKPGRADFRRHQDQGCPKARVVQDYYRRSKGCFTIEANVCTLCNYVQLYRSNIEKHLHMQHNMKEISPKHIQKISLLSKPTPLTASTGSKIDSRRWNKSGDAPSLQSASCASNPYVIYDHGDDNDVTFDKILPEETPTQTNPPTNKNTFEEFISCHKATRDLNNSDGSLSLLLASHAEKSQEIVIDDDDENNDNHALASALEWPKNVDPQMFINDENRDRCVICNKDFNSLVQHYVNEHRGCEIYNSRLSPSQIKLVKQGRYEVSNVIQNKRCKFYEAFCIFCEKNLHSKLRYWYEHFTRHTGEFAYRCTGCGLRKPARPDFRRHQDQGCPKARIVQDYFRSLKGYFPIEANVCTLCNYVQLYRSNIEKHLHLQHNMKEISPEHIQTIALLSKPTSMTESTGSKIDSRRWNKTRDLKNSNGFSSLLLPLHADKNQQRIIDDDENNDKSSLDFTLDWPKNVDTQVFINDKNKDRCVICNKDFIGRLVNHYVNEHRGCEIYNSRLSRSQIKLVKQGRCEVSKIRVHNNHKYNEAFCIFCQKNLRFVTRYWYYHFTRHTGEYAYRCTGCGLRKPGRDDIKTHQAQRCSKARVAQDYFRGSKNFLPIEAYICNLCNYVQLDRSNIERHLRIQHNIETIFPEHIQTIVLLSKPACMTATSTGSVIDSSLGDEEVDEIIVPDGADDKDLTDDNNKEQLIEEKIPSDGVVEKKTSKTCVVDEKDEDSGDNKSFLNNDVQDASSEYSEEYKTEFITLEEDELNKIQVESSEEFKGVCPQKEEEVNRIATKSGETIVNIKKNKEKAVKKLETTIDDGKNITATINEIFENKEITKNNNNIDKEEPEHQKDFKIITNENNLREGTEYDNKEFYGVSDPASEEETEDFAEDVKDVKIPGDVEVNENEDVEQVAFQHKIKQKRLEARKQQKVKSYKSTFIQSLVTRSQRLGTSVKRLKRSPEAGINASTQSIRLNDTISATVTSIEDYTENNDAEDLFQATWTENLENDEGQVSDYEVKKQQQSHQQQDRYLSKSELPTICKPSPSPISTSNLSERLYERNQEAIIVGDDDDNENNGNSSLGFPKNVDPQMVINDKNKDRCVICNQEFVGRLLVHHYVNEHRGCEIYNSRLSPSQIKLVKQGRCEVSNVSLHKTRKYYEAFCIFCKTNLRLILRYWYQHFTRHTGEFAYRCTSCGMRKPLLDFREHKAQKCLKMSVAQDYLRNSKTFPIVANVCTLCNYVQLYRSNIEGHLNMQHNIKQILPEHIQTIALLSKPTSITASTHSKVDSRRWNKSDAALSLPSSSHPSNTYVIGKDCNDDNVTFEKMIKQETPLQANLPMANKTFEEFTNWHRATGNSNNSDGSSSLLLSSHAEKIQQKIIIVGDDDNGNNDNPLLVSALGFPKNVDPQMFITDENRDRCFICNQNFIGRLVYHYVNEHRGCEIYNSRLSPSQITRVKQGVFEISNVRVYKKRKHYEAFCIFCQKNLRLISLYWYYHFTRHTGEFAYRCTGCDLRKPMPDFKEHQAQECPKARVAEDYFRNSKTFPIEANVCNLCNYVQLYRSNIEKHLHVQHNIKEILNEHIHTIVLLSIPTSMTATSTSSKIDSRLWNNSDIAASLPSSKIAPQESPPQTDHLTINNTFDELTNSYKATGNSNNSGGSPLDQSKRASMTATTSSKIESTCWNKSCDAPSFQSSSYASNTYVNDEYDDDNDVTCDKILPEETPTQTDAPTINNKFEKFANCYRATRRLNNDDGSPSLALLSEDVSNTDVIDKLDNDNNVTFEKMVKPETSPQAKPTINNTFKKSTNSHKVICSKIITLADVTVDDAT